MVFLSCLAWQGYIYFKCIEDYGGDVRGRFFGIPAFIATGVTLLTVAGASAYLVLAWIDPEITADGWNMGKICLGVLLLTIGFCLKSYIGAVLLGATATWSLWNLMMHGKWTFIPIFKLVFQLVADFLPDWACFVYVSLTLIYALGSSIFGSVAE